jgi:Ser/Thr protein kinase RdoA (MazF antagonist)
VTEPGVPTDDTLAAPFVRMTDSALAVLAERGWGLQVESVRRLATERDDTVLVTHAAGRHVLKVAHPLDDPALLDFQCSAMRHALARDPGLPLATLLPDRDGAVLREVLGADGEPRRARVLSYLDGVTLDYAVTSLAQREEVGCAAGRLSAALADFEHPGSVRVLAWDLAQLGSLRPLLEHVADPEVRALVAAELDTYDDHVGAALRASRQQVIHNDVNVDNVVVDPSDPAFVHGILDFGDAVHGSVVGDLAVAMSYAAGVGGAADVPWGSAYDVARGFVSARELTDDETVLLPDLVRARFAQRLLLNSWLAAEDPANAHYTGRAIARTAATFRRLVEAPAPIDRAGG